MSPETTGPRSQPAHDGAQEPPSDRAERIALAFSRAWGEMGPLWAVPPALARVHGYLLARRVPLSEREIREALGLSHRAASVALAECEAWGLIHRVEARRSGRRGPAGTAYQAVDDHWRWLRDLVAQRKVREADPIVQFLRDTLVAADAELGEHPGDRELEAQREWLAGFLAFVEVIVRAISLVPEMEPDELAHAMRIFGRLPERTVVRLLRVLTEIPEDDALALVNGLSQLSPAALRRVAGLVRALPGER